jgi:hypothetical protein
MKEFNETKKLKLIKDIEKEIKIDYNSINYLITNCA